MPTTFTVPQEDFDVEWGVIRNRGGGNYEVDFIFTKTGHQGFRESLTIGTDGKVRDRFGTILVNTPANLASALASVSTQLNSGAATLQSLGKFNPVR